MAVSQIEEKILGRLARQVEYAEKPDQEKGLLAAALYQTLGLSILLSRKLFRARKVRRLDITRDTKSLKLYHHIIWLAREGWSITEVYILPRCQDGEYGAECRVMAAKLRASFYHVFCLFHNHPPISNMGTASPESLSPSSGGKMARPSKASPGRSPRENMSSNTNNQKKPSKLRDPIPSMTSEISYVTNPFAALNQTPPPNRPVPPLPNDPLRRTPIRPPGLNIPSPSSAGAYLLPPLNFVPLTKDYFQSTQDLANSLLAPTHALRLAVSLEHAAFVWECEKDHDRARQLARKTIKEVYTSTDGLDDDEFADAAAIVQTLAGLLRRNGNPEQESTQRSKSSQSTGGSGERRDATRQPLRIDRTISISPTEHRARRPDLAASIPRESMTRTPERLSTVPEVESTASEVAAPERSANTSVPPTSTALTSPSLSRRSSRRPSSSAASDKASKRRLVEQAEEAYHRRNSSASRTSTRSPSSTYAQNEAQGDTWLSRNVDRLAGTTPTTTQPSHAHAKSTKTTTALRPPRSPIIPSMKPATSRTASRNTNIPNRRQTASPAQASRGKGQTEGPRRQQVPKILPPALQAVTLGDKPMVSRTRRPLAAKASPPPRAGASPSQSRDDQPGLGSSPKPETSPAKSALSLLKSRYDSKKSSKSIRQADKKLAILKALEIVSWQLRGPSNAAGRPGHGWTGMA